MSKYTDESVPVTASMQTYANGINTDNFNIGIYTDPHYDIRDLYPNGLNSNYVYGRYGQSSLISILKSMGNTADVLHLNGDNVNGITTELANNQKQNKVMLSSWFSDGYGVTADRTATIGNHDDGSPHASVGNLDLLNSSNTVSVEWFQNNIQYPSGSVRDTGSLSFYKDYVAKKVRYIVLDTEEPPLTVNTAGNYVYNRWLWHGLTQHTLSWLVDSALKNVPADYTTLVVTHCPIWFNDGKDYQWGDSGANMVNFEVFTGILNAFITGTKYTSEKSAQSVHDWLNIVHKNSSEFTNNYPVSIYGAGWEINITADFSTQGKRKFAGVFSGHTHQEKLSKIDNFYSVQLQHGFPWKNKDLGTDNQLGFTTISIDTINQQVELIGFGYASNRSYKY
ncbi:hypothetical protein ACFP1L_11855 [Lactiplantibacillus nangangensis]|uniref:Calcineurin-like phosphoesterase domain-containing protein n=1 Tax=Lactiplantibacillus nangangensis TaxID=2559917 RepID=A0ABW1SLI8_9LACO|nr:hypothetical protein [Lactiplantibacillus nangangensis]